MYTELNILRLNERINTSNGFWDDMYNPYCTWSSWRADGQQRRSRGRWMLFILDASTVPLQGEDAGLPQKSWSR
uniref:Recombining binding protein suppressor of hairless-like n=1 Tax=Steinernema glaseri TaxID=37863 RepID=A0A1I8AHC0_9BILA